MELEACARQVVDAAYHVHVSLGPGLLEGIYEACLAVELAERGVPYQRQQSLPVFYKQQKIDAALRLDFLIADSIVVEIKSVERLMPIHEAQLLTYLKLSRRPLGFLINFNVVRFKEGIRRFAS